MNQLIPTLSLRVIKCQSGDCYAESDAEEPAPPTKRGRGAKKAKANPPEAPAKGKSNGRKKGRKAAGKDAAAADKVPGAGTVASKPSDESQAGGDQVNLCSLLS